MTCFLRNHILFESSNELPPVQLCYIGHYVYLVRFGEFTIDLINEPTMDDYENGLM